MQKTYQYHRPTPQAAERIEKIRRACSDLHDLIEGHSPPSRERSLAFTNLEQAQMWTVKAIVLNDPESVVG